MTETLRRFASEHRRLLVVLALVLMGDLVFYLFVQSPLAIRARSLAGQVNESDTQLRAALGDYGRALLESKLLQGADTQIGELYVQTFQSDRERYPVVDAKIKELAAKFRLAPHSLSYGYQQLNREGLEQLEVGFVLKGSYDNLRKFLAEIEQARDEQSRDLFFAVDRITLNDSTETGSELNLTIAVTTYFHKPELAQEWQSKRTRGGRPRSGGRS